MDSSNDEITSVSGCVIRVFGVMVGPTLALITLFAATLNEGATRWWSLGVSAVFTVATVLAIILDRRAGRKRTPEDPPV